MPPSSLNVGQILPFISPLNMGVVGRGKEKAAISPLQADAVLAGGVSETADVTERGEAIRREGYGVSDRG